VMADSVVTYTCGHCGQTVKTTVNPVANNEDDEVIHKCEAGEITIGFNLWNGPIMVAPVFAPEPSKDINNPLRWSVSDLATDLHDELQRLGAAWREECREAIQNAVADAIRKIRKEAESEPTPQPYYAVKDSSAPAGFDIEWFAPQAP